MIIDLLKRKKKKDLNKRLQNCINKDKEMKENDNTNIIKS